MNVRARRGGAYVAAFLFASSAAAQDVVVRGRVLGPDGAPFAVDRVLLHRVDQSGGATVAETAADSSGRFTLTATASADTSGVYFVAARYQGELYIGQPFRAAAAIPEQILQVGVAGTSAAALLSDVENAPPPRPATKRSWWLLLLPLLGASTAVFYLLVPRRRIVPERALLIRIAEIDERLDGAPPGQRDAMREERSQLIEQLRAG